MAKDPAFLFYPGDWLGGTMTFSRAHKGAYMDLLMCQFNQGRLSIEDIKTVLGDDFDSMWEGKLKKKFQIDENGLCYNEKLEIEIIKRKKYTASRRENLTHKESDIDSHMSLHMENEIENENRNNNNFEKSSKRKTFKKPSLSEIKKYVLENKYSIDPEQFFNFYESKGWRVGNQPMKNWQAAVRTWHGKNGRAGPTVALRDMVEDKYANVPIIGG